MGPVRRHQRAVHPARHPATPAPDRPGGILPGHTALRCPGS